MDLLTPMCLPLEISGEKLLPLASVGTNMTTKCDTGLFEGELIAQLPLLFPLVLKLMQVTGRVLNYSVTMAWQQNGSK